jgi:hypothetical protein
VITPEKGTLLIILCWCILEIAWDRVQGLAEPGFIRVLLVVNACPQLLEGRVRKIHWEMNYLRRTPVEIGVCLDFVSGDHGELVGLLVRDGLVTVPGPDERPDVVIRI